MATIAAALDRRNAVAEVLSAASPPRNENAARQDSIVDWDQTLRELEGNAQLLQILVEATLEESPRLMAAIRAAVDARRCGQPPHIRPYAQGGVALFW